MNVPESLIIAVLTALFMLAAGSAHNQARGSVGEPAAVTAG